MLAYGLVAYGALQVVGAGVGHDHMPGQIPKKRSFAKITVSSLSIFMNKSNMTSKRISAIIFFVTLIALKIIFFGFDFTLVGFTNMASNTFFAEKCFTAKFALVVQIRPFCFRLDPVGLLHVEPEQVALVEVQIALVTGVTWVQD